MSVVFPNNNLPTSSQPWAREVQKQLSNIILSSTSSQINNAARDNQLNSSIIAITGVVNDLSTVQANITSALVEIGLIEGQVVDLEDTVLVDGEPTKINGANIKVGTLSASQITTGTLNAGVVNVTNLDADNITSGTITASIINGGSITASNIRLTGSQYELRVGTTSDWAYLRVAPQAANGLGFNEIGFAASATSGISGWVSNCFPSSDNSYSIGTTQRRWDTIYSNTGTINTSDMRLKKEIQSSSLGLNFIKSLNPVSYKWIVGSIETLRDENGDIVRDENGNLINIERPGIRDHWGFIAQEVKEAVIASGVQDFAGFVQDDITNSDSMLSLRYEEFIAPMVKAIQELSAKVEELEKGA